MSIEAKHICVLAAVVMVLIGVVWFADPAKMKAQQSNTQQVVDIPTASAEQKIGLSNEDLANLRKQKGELGWTFEVGHNAATERSISDLCGWLGSDDDDKQVRHEFGTSRDDLPVAFDWRILGSVTPVQDQGQCGSCWAFSAVAPVESAILIKEGILEDLSEQWLVSCETSSYGCDGGYMYRALDDMECYPNPEWERGAVLEEDFPYEADDLSCQPPYTHPYCIDNRVPISYNVDQLKQAILDYGPISVGVYVNTAFQAYTGGIFNACGGSSGGHGVALVGWDDNQGEEGVWIMKNSWGPDWGEYGYMRIQYGCKGIGRSANAVDYNPDCNDNGIRDKCETDCDYVIPYLGHCSVLYPEECGTADNCNSNDMPDECERDCNDNGVPDDCDIASEYSLDLNLNSLPDECEAGIDCNENDIFDFYDIWDGTSTDFDVDEVPDECQDCWDGTTVEPNGVFDWEDLERPQALMVVAGGDETAEGLFKMYFPDTGTRIGAYGAEHLDEPYGITVGPNRHIYVTSSGDNRVVEFDIYGNYLQDLITADSGLAYPTGVTVGPDGNLYVSSRDTHSIFMYNLTTEATYMFITPHTAGLNEPYDLIFGPENHLYVSSNGTDEVMEFDDQGQLVASYTYGYLHQPRGLALQPNGNLLVVSLSNNRILQFDRSTGEYQGVFKTVSSSPGGPVLQGLTWGPNGLLYFLGYSGHVLRIYECDGQTGRILRTFNRGDPDLINPAGLTFIPSSPYDCDNNYTPDACESQEDCNDNGTQDICDIADGTSSDCNENSIPDECDIDQETSADCNGNSVPDECDLEEGASSDCNENSIPDECDLASGTSQDIKPPIGDGILDECQGEIIYVDDDAPADPAPGNPGVSDPDEDGSPDHPYGDLEEAINSATQRDIILVKDGIYPGLRLYSDDDKALSICSESGSHHSIIDAGGLSYGVYFYRISASTQFQGFTITNASSNGLICYKSRPTIQNCRVVGNQWGVYVLNPGHPIIRNCLIAANAFGASIRNGGSATFSNCTIVQNGLMGSYGVYVQNSPGTVIHNSILWGNGADQDPQVVMTGSSGSLTVTYSDVQGGPDGIQAYGVHSVQWGPGNITSDPLLTDPDGPDDDPATWQDNNYRLRACSPCLDAGDEEFVPRISETDLDGQPRLMDGDGDEVALVDMGADEYDAHATADSLTVVGPIPNQIIVGGEGQISATVLADFVGLLDREVIFTKLSGSFTFTDGEVSPDGQQATVITDCEGTTTITFTGDEIGPALVQASVADTDLTAFSVFHIVEDCNQSGQLDYLDIDQGISEDCNDNDIPDECEISLADGEECGMVTFCSEQCADDCNDNCVPDECDIAEGTSNDCNNNNLPDECDLADCDGSPWCDDCNENGVLDVCDIGFAHVPFSEDCNRNGIPDECEDDPCPICDLNNDGKVDLRDQEIIKLCLRSSIQEPPNQCQAADVDGDGRITEKDWDLFWECYQSYVNPGQLESVPQTTKPIKQSL